MAWTSLVRKAVQLGCGRARHELQGTVALAGTASQPTGVFRLPDGITHGIFIAGDDGSITANENITFTLRMDDGSKYFSNQKDIWSTSGTAAASPLNIFDSFPKDDVFADFTAATSFFRPSTFPMPLDQDSAWNLLAVSDNVASTTVMEVRFVFDGYFLDATNGTTTII